MGGLLGEPRQREDSVGKERVGVLCRRRMWQRQRHSRSDDHQSATARKGEYSRHSDDNDDYSHTGDNANYAIAIDTVPHKRAKHESVPAKPAAKKSCVMIALSDDDEDEWSDASAKLGKLAQSFAVFPPPGGAERKQAARKKQAKDNPMEDLADTP